MVEKIIFQEEMNRYVYEAEVLDVYDADTCTLMIDVGFNIHLKEKVRFLGIDTPEIRTRNKKEKKLGIEARDWLRLEILGKKIKLKTHKEGKFGRYLVEIIKSEEPYVTYNNILVEKGFARVYDGGARLPWFE